MRVKFLVSTALCAGLLAGCNGGSHSGAPSPGYVTEDTAAEVSDADVAAMSPEQRERYAANAISPVRRVAEAPVSTFAVRPHAARPSGSNRAKCPAAI